MKLRNPHKANLQNVIANYRGQVFEHKMDDETMKKVWDAFAKSIGGTVQASKANYLDRDNYYKIKTDNTEIELIWSNQPQRGRGPYVTLESKLKFTLKGNSLATLTVRPKDFLTNIFSFKKQKFGVAELDKAYLFNSNSEGLIYELTDLFKDFYRNNKYKNFVIKTENISDAPTLTIFIPELLTTQNKLEFYYNFGLKISKKISADT